MTFIATWPQEARTPEGDVLLVKHRELCGTWPDYTPEQEAHADQTRHVKVGYNGAPKYEHTCPACGIRWRDT